MEVPARSLITLLEGLHSWDSKVNLQSCWTFDCIIWSI